MKCIRETEPKTNTKTRSMLAWMQARDVSSESCVRADILRSRGQGWQHKEDKVMTQKKQTKITSNVKVGWVAIPDWRLLQGHNRPCFYPSDCFRWTCMPSRAYSCLQKGARQKDSAEHLQVKLATWQRIPSNQQKIWLTKGTTTSDKTIPTKRCLNKNKRINMN